MESIEEECFSPQNSSSLLQDSMQENHLYLTLEDQLTTSGLKMFPCTLPCNIFQLGEYLLIIWGILFTLPMDNVMHGEDQWFNLIHTVCRGRAGALANLLTPFPSAEAKIHLSEPSKDKMHVFAVD